MTWYDDNKHLFFKKYDDEVLIKEITNYRNGKSSRINKTLAHFFDYDMYSCKGGRGSKTPLEIIKDDEQIKDILDFTKTKPKFYTGTTEVSHVKSFLRNAGRKAQKVSNFPIQQATDLYKEYSNEGDTIYDPSCGFGSRMSACILNGRTYVGTDPNFSLVKSLNMCLQFYKDNFMNVGESKIIPTGSEIYHEDLKDCIDFIFTSPPYFDLEIYGNDSGQSVIKFPRYEDWLKGYVEPTVKNCTKYLKKGKYIIINIKGSKKHDLFNDWKNIMSKYLTFIKISSIEQSSKRQYGDKHFTGVKTDFGLKEEAMVFMKEKEIPDQPTVLPKGKVVTEECPEGIAIPEESEKLICELCKVDYTGSTKEEHEQRPFHQRAVRDLE